VLKRQEQHILPDMNKMTDISGVWRGGGQTAGVVQVVALRCWRVGEEIFLESRG
jgi:hypothetical protein